MSNWRIADNIRWAVDLRGVVLINDATGGSTPLSYPQAAVWDLLTRGEPKARIHAKLCAIASLEPEAAEALLAGTISALREAGFVVPEESGRG